MAQLEEPFNFDQPDQLVRVYTCEEDDLPPHVKNDVQWLTDHHLGPGYYLYDYLQREYLPVEFIEDFWYNL